MFLVGKETGACHRVLFLSRGTGEAVFRLGKGIGDIPPCLSQTLEPGRYRRSGCDTGHGAGHRPVIGG